MATKINQAKKIIKVNDIFILFVIAWYLFSLFALGCVQNIKEISLPLATGPKI